MRASIVTHSNQPRRVRSFGGPLGPFSAIALALLATCCSCQSVPNSPTLQDAARNSVAQMRADKLARDTRAGRNQNTRQQWAWHPGTTHPGTTHPGTAAPGIYAQTSPAFGPGNGFPANGGPANGIPANLATGDVPRFVPRDVAMAAHTTGGPSAGGASAAMAPMMAPGMAPVVAPAMAATGPTTVSPAAHIGHRAHSPALPCPICHPSLPTFCQPCMDPQTGEIRDPNEFLCDGGDDDPEVRVSDDWTVRGLNPEDTIAHFDTTDGRREVTASNKVCLYAPRFSSVRKVTGLGLHEQHDRLAGVVLPTRLQNQEERQIVTSVVQPLQPGRNLGIHAPNAFREQASGVGIDQRQAIAGLERQFMPYENFEIIRRGQFDANEKLRLNNWLQAAITWSHDLGVQVMIDNEAAVEMAGQSKSQGLHVYEMPPGKSRVRICKVASRDDAQPGDLVEFTLRFDNVGDQVVGNVTIIDNLTTRLEYVPESADCNLKADFSTQENDGESLILRWDIKDPLPVGEGGLIRFKCRVR